MRSLLLVDLQNDFLPGGALAVSRGDEVIPLANRLQDGFDLVIATQDWHPATHASFAANHAGKAPGDVIELKGLQQILWPVHCVQNSHGAELAHGLTKNRIKKIFYKGIDVEVDSYSAFYDNARQKATGLAAYLIDSGVDEVFVMGLATDYCVKFTVLDGCELGFHMVVIEDACRGVNLKPNDVDKAIEEMRKAGVEIAQSEEILHSLHEQH